MTIYFNFKYYTFRFQASQYSHEKKHSIALPSGKITIVKRSPVVYSKNRIIQTYHFTERMNGYMTLGALIWLSLAILLGMIEGMTAGLVSIWFAGGAVVAFITALLGLGFVLQIVVFVAASAILLACMRSLTQKKMPVETVPTNADRILGRLAVVSEPIDNLNATGAVRIDGVEWTARCRTDDVISAGETVKIMQIDGVKVIVEPSLETVGENVPSPEQQQPEQQPAQNETPAGVS